LLDEAKPSPATAMSSKYYFRPCIVHYFLVDSEPKIFFGLG
jgi:hypothetical protein